MVTSCFISIHSPRMGRDALCVKVSVPYDISIHSPRMGRDRVICFPLGSV